MNKRHFRSKCRLSFYFTECKNLYVCSVLVVKLYIANSFEIVIGRLRPTDSISLEFTVVSHQILFSRLNKKLPVTVIQSLLLAFPRGKKNYILIFLQSLRFFVLCWRSTRGEKEACFRRPPRRRKLNTKKFESQGRVRKKFFNKIFFGYPLLSNSFDGCRMY